MRYEELSPIDRVAAELELGSGDRERISRALVRIALHASDREWAEQHIILFLQNDDPWIRGVSATCVGHLVRIHHAVSLSRILPLLTALLSDPATAGRAQEAIDDIRLFVEDRDNP